MKMLHAGAPVVAPILIDQPPKRLKQARQTLHLIKNDEPVRVAGQQGSRLVHEG